MSSNGHADADAANSLESGLISGSAAAALVTSPEEIKRLVRELELPFEATSIDWRVTNTNHLWHPSHFRNLLRGSHDLSCANCLFASALWHVQDLVDLFQEVLRFGDKNGVSDIPRVYITLGWGLGTGKRLGEECKMPALGASIAGIESSAKPAVVAFPDLPSRRAALSIPRIDPT